jgi:hypothetical protein
MLEDKVSWLRNMITSKAMQSNGMSSNFNNNCSIKSKKCVGLGPVS